MYTIRCFDKIRKHEAESIWSVFYPTYRKMADIINFDSDGTRPEVEKFFQSKIGKDFSDRLKRPSVSSDQDFFAAIFHETLIGCALIEPEPEIERIILNIYVLPDFRELGYGSLLLKKTLKRGKDLKARKVHVYVDAYNNKTARGFLAKHGFKRIRCFLDMEVKLDRVQMRKFLSNDITVINLEPGQEKKLAAIQNRIFTGSWGFCPNTSRDIEYFLYLTSSRLQDVLIMNKKGNPFGYFWSHSVSSHQVKGKCRDKRARIHMFGLEKDFRSKGNGYVLFSLGLNDLRKKEVDFVGLTVDSLNYPAVNLYKKFGFRTIGRKYWYELLLND